MAFESSIPCTRTLRRANGRTVIFSLVANPMLAGAGKSRTDHLPFVTGSYIPAPHEEGLKVLGVESRCASVRSSGLAVLDLDQLPREEVCARLADEARIAVEQDGAEVILLGCAGMAGLQEVVASAVHVPVVDAVWAGVTLVGALARAGARTSKRNLYQPVEPRPTVDAPPGVRRIYRPT